VILDYKDFENIMATIDELEEALISVMTRGRSPRRCKPGASQGGP
jgi:hypothetical protein